MKLWSWLKILNERYMVHITCVKIFTDHKPLVFLSRIYNHNQWLLPKSLGKAMSPYRRHPLQKRFTEYCSRRSLLCCLKDCTQPWVWFLMGVTCQDRWHGCFSVSLFSSRCKASTYWPIQTLLAHAYWLIWAQETNHSPGIITNGAAPWPAGQLLTLSE